MTCPKTTNDPEQNPAPQCSHWEASRYNSDGDNYILVPDVPPDEAGLTLGQVVAKRECARHEAFLASVPPEDRSN
jgi:hypothetical protein